jgi:nucleoside phosphorylase
VPFTARLPRLPPELWERIDRALTGLEACMGAAPRHAERIEADAPYVERLAVALKEVGASIQAARLKNDVIDPRSWPTESQAESWGRALLQRGFDPSLSRETLAEWLGQTNGEGERPGGDPVFFGLMRSSLSDFATTFREMTRPQQAPLPDGPLTRTPAVPRRDGEEEHPFLQHLRDQEKRKREADAAAEERRQKLQPLREALQRVDDTLSSVQGPDKPPQQTCQAAAAALFANLKAFRAALDAAGKGGALEALRREATLPDERRWLLDVLLSETSAEAIAQVLQLGDRSHLLRAWQDLAQDCWNWHPAKAADPANAVAPAEPQATGVTQRPATAKTETVKPVVPSETAPAQEQAQQPTVGILTALPLEAAAVRAVFNEPPRLDVPGSGPGRAYWLAQFPSPRGGTHRVVIAQADMGNNVAAIRASLLLTHFATVESIIMCGIAGGIPHPGKPPDHVRLGDIVVSNLKGVVQYDLVKRARRKKGAPVFEEVRASGHRPSAALSEAVRILEANRLLGERPWEAPLRVGLTRLAWARPDASTDVLADPADLTEVIPHPADNERRGDQPRVFFGVIASANTLLKDPVRRDALRDEHGAKAVEMEGSGVQDATWTHGVGYLVVRGICDYCDRNKNDDWQKYAAMAAAAYVRALLETMPGTASHPPQYTPDTLRVR